MYKTLHKKQGSVTVQLRFARSSVTFCAKRDTNDSYYLLKKTKGTIVIVECGFLSNAAEAGKLCDEAYQDRVAWSIHKGILQYINGIQRD